jgi:hypothetical protein
MIALIKLQSRNNKNMCLQLTIFSGDREPHSSIGKAKYIINNGPIFVDKISVKSLTIFNTEPNISENRNTMVFFQSGPSDALDRIEVQIPIGDYTAQDLAAALETAMNVAMTQSTASVILTYDPLTRKMYFAFDNTYSYILNQDNPMENVLNFSINGVIGPHNWLSGAINLSGDMYIHFRSRILADRNHRTITNGGDTTFFSLPITSTFTQLQYHEPNERIWIQYSGGIEMSSFEIDMFNEHNQRIEPTSNYVLELLIKQSIVC